MRVEVPLGDVVDRATILEIKVERLARPEGIANAVAELAALDAAWSAEELPPMRELPHWTELSRVNRALWDVEDRLRDCERDGRFDGGFVALARSVYRLNDERAEYKRAINLELGSRLVEEKSYARWR
jgi:hypothetical protein